MSCRSCSFSYIMCILGKRLCVTFISVDMAFPPRMWHSKNHPSSTSRDNPIGGDGRILYNYLMILSYCIFGLFASIILQFYLFSAFGRLQSVTKGQCDGANENNNCGNNHKAKADALLQFDSGYGRVNVSAEISQSQTSGNQNTS